MICALITFLSYPRYQALPVKVGEEPGNKGISKCELSLHLVWFPDPSCVGGAREGREGRVW